MTFEAYVIDVKEATYTVRSAANGAIYQNCRLCAMGVSDWCVSKDDYVLCDQTEYGRTYILGEIKGRVASTEGIRLGESDTDKFVVTQDATLIHQRDINTTIIDADGLEAFYKKVTIKGFGTLIEVDEDSIEISVPGNATGTSKITITPTEVKIDAGTIVNLQGGDAGFLLKGDNLVALLNEIISVLRGHITKYNSHTHICAAPASPSAAPLPLETGTITKTPQQSTKVKSS